ncbi:MAG: HD-GYP domain-containing protein [Planctomycetes bacterium]|nr:HD-GYP domain-containing protein [Planctomycetota bacterium]
MNHRDSHLRTHGAPSLPRRLRDVGLLLLDCDATGKLVSRPSPGRDWLTDLFCQAPIFIISLRKAAAEWARQEPVRPLEVFPGCWLAPLPRVARRRRIGYTVAVIATTPFLDSEQLSAMCQAAKADYTLIRQRLAGLPLVDPGDVGRIAALVRWTLEDQLRLAADRETMESVGQQLAECYEELNLMYTTIQGMSGVQRPLDVIAMVCEKLRETLPYAWIGAQLADDNDRLKKLSGKLIMAGEPGQPVETIRALGKRTLAKVTPQTPMVLEPVTNTDHAGFAKLGSTVLVHPVGRGENVIGVLIAGERLGPDPAPSSVDMKLLGATATILAVFLENVALYDDLHTNFMGTLEALTASIDAKDTYTSGHSLRVAHLTELLAKEINLDEHTVKRMRIAGLVHDIGKIGVPEAVLTKPGKLTEEEFASMRRHPEIGHRILKDIPELRDILPGVLSHHERFDGQGYPHGISGDKIPRVARLISLADAFDAMSSTRTYRATLSRPEVIQEILDCAGTQFDPELAPVFVKLDFSEFDRLFEEHRIRERTERGKDQAA